MRLSVPLTCATLALSLLSGPAVAQQTKPSLVVIIVVDQMRRDYIRDYGPKWSKGDQKSWEEQIKTRQLSQHEDRRIYQ